MCKSFLYHKRNKYSERKKNYSMFSRWIYFRRRHHIYTHLTANIEKNHRMKKNSRGTGKNKEIFKFYGVEWCRVLVAAKCERKILAGKKYEKCNKFYYYDVSTSLVCIKHFLNKNEREISAVGACGVRKVNGERFGVNCLIEWGDLNLLRRFKLHLLFHNPTSADDKSWENFGTSTCIQIQRQ